MKGAGVYVRKQGMLARHCDSSLCFIAEFSVQYIIQLSVQYTVKCSVQLNICMWGVHALIGL